MQNVNKKMHFYAIIYLEWSRIMNSNDFLNKNSQKDQNSSIETLNMNESVKDIPTSKFKSILDVEKQQEELLKNYEAQKSKEVEVKIPDLSNDVRILEKKLQAKKHSISVSVVILLILAVNILWILGVHFFINPKYERCVVQNEELQKENQELKEQINSSVGE